MRLQDMLAAERDYLKQELGMFMEQIESLEKERAALSQELEEKGEIDEFKSLEEEFRKEHEVRIFFWLDFGVIQCFYVRVHFHYVLFVCGIRTSCKMKSPV